MLSLLAPVILATLPADEDRPVTLLDAGDEVLIAQDDKGNGVWLRPNLVSEGGEAGEAYREALIKYVEPPASNLEAHVTRLERFRCEAELHIEVAWARWENDVAVSHKALNPPVATSVDQLVPLRRKVFDYVCGIDLKAR
jgi:hypothetical protein